MNHSNLNLQKKVFQKASITYYYSSLFFPSKIWQQVTTLYAFVRYADDLVDKLPVNPANLNRFVKNTWLFYENKEKDLNNKKNQNDEEKIIIDFVNLAKKINIKKDWIESFFAAMISDLPKNNKNIVYRNKKELAKYIYGSAEVVGLMMCQILQLPKDAYPFACKQGVAMQVLNFIRDINEDCNLNRQYLASFLVNSQKTICLTSNPSEEDKQNFKKFMANCLSYYYQIQTEAEKGYKYIPYRYRVPIVTAAKLYEWTANTIARNPLIVFERKVKPTKLKVFLTLINSLIICLKY